DFARGGVLQKSGHRASAGPERFLRPARAPRLEPMKPAVHLDPRGSSAARARHPWIFSGAVARVVGDPEAGAEVDVLGADGAFLGRGLFNPHSQIRVRLYTEADEPLHGA